MFTKSRVCLLDEIYKNPKTSLLTFTFNPSSAFDRLSCSKISKRSIEGKEIYLFDGLFTKEETADIQSYSQEASFSRNSYGSSDAITSGEKPARSMNGKERWLFFSHPPAAIQKLYQIFGTIGKELKAEISTLPWELCDRSSHGSPAVIANFVEEVSKESMELGIHQDSSPEEKISFGIPVLYSNKGEIHSSPFSNGEKGRPWIISAMLYVTKKDFLPEYGMGTIFYDHQLKAQTIASCINMRLVLFEGDIFHSIEKSTIPKGIDTWRVSYVFKLMINPFHKKHSSKKMFSEWINSIQR